jgi:hypothetical protein
MLALPLVPALPLLLCLQPLHPPSNEEMTLFPLKP